jgi:hypothetical protein
MTLTTLNGPTIQPGDALSDGLDCSAGQIVQIIMPSTWSHPNIAADLTFQISTDGQGYNDLYLPTGREVFMPCHPGSTVILHTGDMKDALYAIKFLKIRSGRKTNPIPQPEQREFAIVLDVP